jgi:hypothetical protein
LGKASLKAHTIITGHTEFEALIDQTNVLIEKYNKLGKTQSTLQE